MNTQIKQLAEQAGFVLWKDESWNPGDTVDWSCRYDDELKKFAELIVQECTTVIEKNLFQGIGWNTSRAVKRHFGIEDEE
jgi:hypothetical protein